MHARALWPRKKHLSDISVKTSMLLMVSTIVIDMDLIFLFERVIVSFSFVYGKRYEYQKYFPETFSPA